MKKALLKIAAVFVAVFALETTASAQGFFERVPFRGAIGTENWTQGWADFTPGDNVYPGDPNYSGPVRNKVTVASDITTNTTWTADNWYELTGDIHVTNNATLTIQAGTVIRGVADTARTRVPFLLVARGAKLVANGTASAPIIFTSGFAPNARTRGDWAGLLIMGNASINANPNGGTLPARTRQFEALPDDPLAVYGGGVNFDDNDSSGVLRFVRVEYAGFAFLPNRELNSITLGGVGRRTVMENVMCSFGRDDSFEWFGGTVNGKRLIAFAGTDDDFDCDEGFRGNIQYALTVRHPRVWETDPTGSSNGFETDNNTGLGTPGQVVPNVNDPQPTTRPIFSNVTVVGPLKAGETSSANLATGQRFSRAVQIRTLAETNIFNSVIAGYATGLDLSHPQATIVPSIQNKALNDSLTVRNTIVITTARSSRITSNNIPASVTFNAANWFMTSGFGNDTLTGSADLATNLGIIAPYYTGASNAAFADISFANVNYGISASSVLATGASFEHPRLRALLTSISDDVIAKGSVAVFPNPASSVANIRFNLRADAAVAVSLTDMAGKQVRTITPQMLNAGVATVEVPTAGLKAGLYIATITVNGQSSSVKVSVQ